MDREQINLSISYASTIFLLIILVAIFYKVYDTFKYRKEKIDFKLPDLTEEETVHLQSTKNAKKIKTIDKNKYNQSVIKREDKQDDDLLLTTAIIGGSLLGSSVDMPTKHLPEYIIDDDYSDSYHHETDTHIDGCDIDTFTDFNDF